MKNKTLCTLVLLLVLCFSIGAFTACNDGGKKDDGGALINQISSELLNGKVANFMGAEGFGIIDKGTTQQKSSSASSFVAQVFADDDTPNEQKKTEFAKETEDGFKDVHFHKNDGTGKGYKDLNKKYPKHHHKGLECPLFDCDDISDEIEQEENSGETETVLSLNARVNKLYNHENFTFMSVSSAVNGKAQVLVVKYRPSIDRIYLESAQRSEYPTAINIENHFAEDGAQWEFGYIKINAEGNNPAGYIPMKINENETGYHTANYWSDHYNQSYIIDNRTGITYSLSQFPYIYSVDKGIIKVLDYSVSGFFKYYKPVIVNSGLTFEEIKLPSDEEFRSNLPTCGTSSSAMIDVYGNMLFNAKGLLSDTVNVDQYGEKKYGNNVILAMANKQIHQELRNQNRYGMLANTLADRYLKANRYHLGSDGRIYRMDFRGFMNDVKIDVLGPNCTWQNVDSSTSVTFDNFYGTIGWWFGLDRMETDSYRITKIANGYAYYSTACASEGEHIWDSLVTNLDLINLGDFVGVVKLPVTGASQDNSHLDYMRDWQDKGFDYNRAFTVFLVGDNQMLFHDNDKLYIKDVETGETASLSSGDANSKVLINVRGNNLVFTINGQTKYLNISKHVNVSDFAGSLSDSFVKVGGELDAYFKFVTEQQ